MLENLLKDFVEALEKRTIENDKQTAAFFLMFLINKFGKNGEIEVSKKEVEYFKNEFGPKLDGIKTGIRDGKVFLKLINTENSSEKVHKCNHCTEH